MRNHLGIKRDLNVDIVSTVPPTSCGIANFSSDTYESIIGVPPLRDGGFWAIEKSESDIDYSKTYGDSVRGVIKRDVGDSWDKIAKEIVERKNLIDKRGERYCVLLQHEYGIFGEHHDDDRASEFVRYLHENGVRSVVVPHTILSEPNEIKRETLRNFGRYADKVICLTPSAVDILNDKYGLPREKLIHVPHGVPIYNSSERRDGFKKSFGLEGKVLISTAGLISASKGIEHGIRGFREALKNKPSEMTYLVAGTPHPETGNKGRKYYDSLIEISKSVGLDVLVSKKLGDSADKDFGKHDIVFVDDFVSNGDLLRIMNGSDIGLLTSVGRDQISSGIGAYWVGMGRPLIATPSPFFKDMEKEGVALLAGFEDSPGIAERIDFLTEGESSENKAGRERRDELCKAAKGKGATMTWDIVGTMMVNLTNFLTHEE